MSTDSNNNQTTNSSSTIQKTKTKKTQGLIRWNALMPISIVLTLIVFYFILFFDSHIRSAIEWAGYKVLGTEVNIQKFESSFINGNVSIKKVQITNAEQPHLNTIEIGAIRFDINWDAILRLKFVVEEMAAENIQFLSKRSYPGKVAPPEPVDNKPSLTSQLQEKALDKITTQNKENILGDLSSFLKTGDYKAQLNDMDSKLKSKILANELKAKWDAKQQEWDSKIKNLPKDSDFKNYKLKFEAIKYKDFKSPQELESSIKQFNDLKKEIESKVKTVDETKKQFVSDLEQIKKDYESLDKQVKDDIVNIKNHLKIPKINAGQIAKSIFMDYLNPYIAKLEKINDLAQKYLPPKYSKLVNDKINPDKILSGQKKERNPTPTDTIQPHPREKGTTYEYPISKGYPLFWIQKINISTQSTEQADYGNIKGQILNIVSNQRQIGKQTELHISGNIPKQNIDGLKLDSYLNNLGDEPEASIEFKIANYKLPSTDLLKNDDGSISIPSSDVSIYANAKTTAFKIYTIALKNDFKNAKFEVSAKEKLVDELLKNSFAQLQTFDLNAQAQGSLSNLNVNVNSSLGQKLETALTASVQKKIDDLNLEIKNKIDVEINKTKSDLEKQISNLTKGYLNNASDSEKKLTAQKNIADEKINQSKKDIENKAKNKLKEEGQKTLDDLKKKFGF